MASNVFGIPVTNATLRELPEFVGVKDIKRKDRAKVALEMKNAQSKDFDVRKYVENLKQQWGTGVSTLCVIYNATGDPLKVVGTKDWYGHMGPAPLPLAIQNGQWGGFLHVKSTSSASGSLAAVVYRGMNGDDRMCDWMAAWNNPWYQPSFRNSSYTQIRDSGYFNESTWGGVYNRMLDSPLNSSDTWEGCYSTTAIGDYTSPVFEAIFTHMYCFGPVFN